MAESRPLAKAGLNPAQKVSVLLRILPDDQCVEVLKNYPETEVELICRELLNPPEVSDQTRNELLKEFNENMAKTAARAPVENIENILARLYGVRRSAEIIRRLKSTETVHEPFATLIEAVGPAAAVEEMCKEIPAVAAFALGEVPAELAAKLLALMPKDMRAGVMVVRARSISPRPELAERLRAGLRRRMQERRLSAPPLDPKDLAASADLISQLPAETSKELLEDLAKLDPVVGQRMAEALFTFNDLPRLEDRDIQKIIPKLNGVDLKMALRKCPAEVSEKVFKNMSDRMSAALKEDIQNTPPQKKEVVEDAQRKISVFIRDLIQKGEVVPKAVETASSGDGAPAAELV